MLDANSLRSSVIYQIFVRQYGPNHDFKDVEDDLDRIQSLGVDIIYLMPIFKIGLINRKGSLGSPYAIYDYNFIDPYLGGEEGAISLINKAHQKGFKIIVDLALNHTSCDATLLEEDENYYYHKDGIVSRKCDDWSDVYDLDYNNPKLRKVIIEKVLYLVKLGFDGFRMDVCSLIPLSFWRELEAEILKINPDIIMLGESVELDFLKYIRTLGIDAPSDQDLYEVFDCLYQYDISKTFNEMTKNIDNLPKYLWDVEKQNKVFVKPKLRYLENHDLERIANTQKDILKQLWVLNYFLPGLTFLYNGSEFGIDEKPDLFELDPICEQKKNDDFSKLFKSLYEIKIMFKDYFLNANFKVESIDFKNKIYRLSYTNLGKKLVLILNFGAPLKYQIMLPAGTYFDYLNKQEIKINYSGDIKIDKYVLIEV